MKKLLLYGILLCSLIPLTSAYWVVYDVEPNFAGNGTFWVVNGNITAYYNLPPTQGNPIINSSFGTNTTNENITIYNVSTKIFGGLTIKNIYTWNINGNPSQWFNLPFEGGSNQTDTKDYSGNSGYDIKVNDTSAITWNATGGHDGHGAYEFTGADERAGINIYHAPRNISNGVSITTWVWINQLDSKYRFIYATATAANFYLAITPSNLITLSYANSTPSQKTLKYPDFPPTNEWIFLTVTIEPNGTVSLYRNGDLKIQSNLGQGIQYSSASTTKTIGNFLSNSPGYYPMWNGTIDDFIVWNSSLTAQQVKMLYANETNTVSSFETTLGETWTGFITPNDGTYDGNTVNASLEVIA